MLNTLLHPFGKLFSWEQILKCALLCILLISGTSVVTAQKNDRAEEYYRKSRKALNELCGERYIPIKTRIYYRKRKINDQALLDSAIVTCERALKHTDEKRKDKIAELSVTLGELYANKGEPSKAIPYYSSSLEKYEDLKFRRKAAIVKYRLGGCYIDVDNLDQAIDLFTGAHKYFIAKKDSIYMSRVETGLSRFHSRMRKNDEAEWHMKRALEISQKIKDTVIIIFCFKGLGTIYGRKASLEHSTDDQKFRRYFQQSIDYFTAAEDLSHKSGNHTASSNTLLNLAICHKWLGNLSLALDYAQLSLSSAETMNNPTEKCYALLEIAEVQINQKAYDEAEEYALKGSSLANEMENLQLQRRALGTLSRLYEGKKDYKKALDYYHEEMGVERMIVNNRNQEQLANAEMKYNADKAKAEKEQAEKELESRNKLSNLRSKLDSRTIYALTISVIAAILILIFVLIAYRLRMARLALKEKQTEVKHLQEKQQLEFDLESRKRETTDLASLLNYKNQFTEKIIGIIGEVLAEQEMDKLKSNLVELKFELNRHKKSTHELDMVSENIETLQREFYEKIRAVYPDITKRELLVASLTKLKIETKEMARILGVSDKSVRTYRYRLKKKLQLEEDKDLHHYIQNL